MLEAVTKDLVFTISLKRSTQNLQLSTNWAGRLHHLCLRERTSSGCFGMSEKCPQADSCTVANAPHSITSSARPRRVNGKLTLSALAEDGMLTALRSSSARAD